MASSITPDGRYVAFVSTPTDLTDNDANAAYQQVYVRDTQTNQTYLVSLGSDGNPANAEAGATSAGQTETSIAEDGNGHLLIAYQSNATNLTANDTSIQEQIFLATLNLDSKGDIQYGSFQTTLVSADSSRNGAGANGDSQDPILSADGITLAFLSDASNLPGASGNARHQTPINSSLTMSPPASSPKSLPQPDTTTTPAPV